VLKGVTLEIDKGQVLVLVGPVRVRQVDVRGASTILEQVNAGRLYVDGDLIGLTGSAATNCTRSAARGREQRRNIGMVFQPLQPVPCNRTALDNIIEGPIQVKASKSAAAIAPRQGSAGTGRPGKKGHRLSGPVVGGQQQRVAIARALAMDPKLMLFRTNRLGPRTPSSSVRSSP